MNLPEAPPEASPFSPLGLMLRALRDRRGITQGDLAARAGFHRNKLVLAERGHRALSVADILAVSDALDLTSAERDALVMSWTRGTKIFAIEGDDQDVVDAVGFLAVNAGELSSDNLAKVVDLVRSLRPTKLRMAS